MRDIDRKRLGASEWSTVPTEGAWALRSGRRYRLKAPRRSATGRRHRFEAPGRFDTVGATALKRPGAPSTPPFPAGRHLGAVFRRAAFIWRRPGASEWSN